MCFGSKTQKTFFYIAKSDQMNMLNHFLWKKVVPELGNPPSGNLIGGSPVPELEIDTI